MPGPTSDPPSHRRIWRRFLGLLIVAALVFMALILLFEVQSGHARPPRVAAGAWTSWIRPLAWALYVAFVAGVLAWYLHHLRRLRRRVRSGTLRCWTCDYDLTALPHARRCPECGAVFTPSVLARRWRSFFRR